VPLSLLLIQAHSGIIFIVRHNLSHLLQALPVLCRMLNSEAFLYTCNDFVT
jgi:hypothetical protein